MISRTNDSIRRLGFWSATLCTIFGLAYIVAQIFEWVGLLGSGGGAENASTPLGLALLLTPSFFLGSAFILLMVSLHERAEPARKVWGNAGIAFAVAYAVLTGMTYFVQLTVVGPRLARGDIAGIEMFVFVPFNSFLYAVDILGYTFMSAATLLGAFTLADDGADRIARRFMIANGLLIPFLVFQMYWHSLIWIAALWAITFPAATISLMRVFANARVPHTLTVSAAA